MRTKLTLTLDSTVVKKAKDYAKQAEKSLSTLIGDYLTELTNEKISTEQISPKLKNIIGAVKLPCDFDNDRVLREYFEEKHR